MAVAYNFVDVPFVVSSLQIDAHNLTTYLVVSCLYSMYLHAHVFVSRSYYTDTYF